MNETEPVPQIPQTPRVSGVSQEPQGGTSKVKTFALVLILILLVATAAAGTWYIYGRARAVPPAEVSTTSLLNQINPDFARAAALRKSKDYAGALSAYKSALTQTQDPIQQVVIQFQIAQTMTLAQDVKGVIALYKQIASNPSYSPVMQAYAVQSMGALFYDRARDPAVTKEIFKDQPYASLADPSRVSISYRNLFNYAASVYPLAESQFYVARWYVGELANASPSPLSASTTQSYKNIVQERFAAGEADIGRARSVPDEQTFLYGTLLIRAVVKGENSYRNDPTSKAQAEDAYQEALNFFGKHPRGREWRAKYLYAGYLSFAYGSNRQTDIVALLQPFYVSSSSAHASIVWFLKLARKSPIDSVLAKRLATSQLEFKNLLLSAGWKESDFAK